MMEERQTVLRGELALLLAVVINSFGVVLMLRSGSGISAISSVPYAFSELFPRVSMGTWTYIFQGLLVLSLMVLRKRFVPEYLFSFVVGFFFGIMIDFHELWISWLPQPLPLRVLYFCISYLVICFGIALSNRCRMPIIPTDLFPRELAEITGTAYPEADTMTWPEAGALTYGETLRESVLTGGDQQGKGTYAWKPPRPFPRWKTQAVRWYSPRTTPIMPRWSTPFLWRWLPGS